MKTKRNNAMRIGGIAEKGFTLVELLIVVIILAILAAIVVPQFASTTDDARASSADSTLAGLRAAIDLYYQQHGDYPGANTALPAVPADCTGTVTGAGALETSASFIQQLSLYSDVDGGACSVGVASFEYGPYLKKPDIPSDPFKDVSALEVVTAGDLNMTATGGDPGGFKYDTKTGKIIINILAHENR